MKISQRQEIRTLAVAIIVWLTLVSGLSAQESELQFDQITTENTIKVKGLSQNSVYCLLQDSKGFMWIGTWDGLNKYDGYKFVVYNRESGLSNTTINALLEDDEKNIWIGTDFGLNKLNRESGDITRYFHESENPNSISDNFITHICQDAEGFIWIATSFGLNRFDKNLGIYTSYNFFDRKSDSARSNYITKIVQDSHGIFWIGTHYGLHCYNPVTGTFAPFDLGEDDGSVQAYNKLHVNDILVYPSGVLCVASRAGVDIIQPGKGLLKRLRAGDPALGGLLGNQVNALMTDRKGRLWVGSTEGIDLFDVNFFHIRSHTSGPGTLNLSNNDIRCIYQDPSGAIWIGTYKGLNKVDQSPSRFNHYQADDSDENSLSDNIVYAVLEDAAGLVWIGTYGGINTFNRQTKRFETIRHDPKHPGGLSSNKIRCMIVDQDGIIWIGTESSGVDRLDPRTGKFTYLYHSASDPNSITENSIISMMADSRGRIWIGTGRGVNIYNPENGVNLKFSKNGPGNVRLSDDHIWSVYEDRKGYFWLGTSEGLDRINPTLDAVTTFRHIPGDANSLSVDRVFSVYQDQEGIYWFGTAGGGLNRFDESTGEFRIYTEAAGLPNNVIYATLEDSEGNLWIPTNWGISKFNKQTEIFVNYDSRDGLQGNEFNAGAYYRNPKGEMYFGGMAGFTVFDPEEILLNKVPPRVVITRVEVFNELRRDDLEDGEIIRLPYPENFFSVEFSALDFTNPSKNLYRYKLENYDEEWIFATALQRRAEYRKVAPGSYRFLVNGSNNDGVWNPEGASLTVIISPPWWKSWIFRVTLAVILVLLGWSLIYLRIRNIRKKHDVEKKMLRIEKQIFELEQKALRLQMNPHFIFNSLNAIQNFVLSNDTDKAVNYLAKFSHLMRMILANSTASNIPLKDELKALTYYMDLEKLRFDDKFVYEVHVDPGIDEEFVEIPPMLFQPYVENAIIHGLVNSPKPGLLEIWLQLAGKRALRCIIQDNGIGREKAIEIRARSGIKRQPRGMIITQERLQILNKQGNRDSVVKVTDLKDEAGEAAGTRIELEIQFKEI